VYDKVLLGEFLNDVSARSGKIWWESSTPPTGRKSTIYWASPANPNEGTVDHTFYLESSILNSSLTYEEESLVNRVIFKNENVIDQDMNSIRKYGVHTLYKSAEGVADRSRLVEIAQYILSQRSTPRASGTIPLEGDVDVNLNQLVQIYEEDSDDADSGFSGLYSVVAIKTVFGETVRTNVTLTSRWENPLIKRIEEMNKKETAGGSNDPLVSLRVETAESRLETPTNGVVLNIEAGDVAGRAGIDRVEDTGTDADYYTVYGGPS